VYQVDGSGKKTAVAENCATDSRTASKGNVTVTDGTLNLSITSADKAINVNYIIIRAVDVEKLPLAEAYAVKGDVNTDGSCTTADLVALRSFMLGAKTTLEDASAADFDSDGKITIIDFCLLKQTLMK
ncbi:MAG: dockerin type I repeat-containing protein, partial [Oscillospiraceae bacterium]|nr:dockerin type I repeat-containing protein [Oscillospiraceae bacterium]